MVGGSLLFYKVNYISSFNQNEFQIHVLDVGQGDALLLRLPNNKSLLIDCGTKEKANDTVSYIGQFLKNEKLSRIDYFVLTHSDTDHVGAGENIINNFEVDTLYRPKIYCQYEIDNSLDVNGYNMTENSSYNQLIQSAYTKNLKIKFNEKGIVINQNECKIEFLAPEDDNYYKSNDYSAVIMITYKTKKVLFMADAEDNVESKLVEQYGSNLKADILKVGHHGSNSSSSAEFLSVVKPEYAIISVAKDNSYNLPDYDILDRLLNCGAKTFISSDIGYFAFEIKDEQIEFASVPSPNFDVALLVSITLVFILIIWKIPFNFVTNQADDNKI